ncbi:hypothetical protein QTP70_008325 [Hemibagrus guttatus]|uniref:Uncharacterized protein n=1 Tax=Hemibagrus guttatus TaxID=175788 RepID=A0AAE0RI49_9TELE|nr:hypothetical protein QTP70_008325 [Hemibagrus guttatus]KAK3574090.1 hypothetical protein QTP86_002862 [Hemibagrus guttatus]
MIKKRCLHTFDMACGERRLGLSHNLRLARICMCMSDALALLGLLIAIPGLRLVKICGESQGRKMKCGMKITAGVLGLMAAVFGLYPVSSLAHATVLEFNDITIPDALPRWEFGDALFIGWVAAEMMCAFSSGKRRTQK